MFYELRQSLCLVGKDYPRGTHQLPKEVLVDKFFLKCVKAGLIIEGEKPKAPVTEPDDKAKGEALLAKIKEEQAKKEAEKPLPIEESVKASEKSEVASVESKPDAKPVGEKKKKSR